MKSKYYKILGISDGVSEVDIRKRYRKLAMQYHPDKNPSKSAQNKFLEITEAYEILIGKRPLPQKRISASQRKTMSKQDVELEKKNRVKEAQKRYDAQKMREKIEAEKYYQFLISPQRKKAMKIITGIASVLIVFILLDLFLPRHQEKQFIERFSQKTAKSINGKLVKGVKTSKKSIYWISNFSFSAYARTNPVVVEKSWFLHQPIRLISIGKMGYHSNKIHYTFYKNFGIAILFLMIPWLYWIYQKRTPYFTVIANLGYYLSGIFILYFLIAGNRWIHAITFGFL